LAVVTVLQTFDAKLGYIYTGQSITPFLAYLFNYQVYLHLRPSSLMSSKLLI